MPRSYSLSPGHYASKWSVRPDDAFHDRDEVNRLAIEYATSEDGPAKEALFLKLVEHFHGVLIKYTNMVIRGQMPSLRTRAGKDAAALLKLLKKGEAADQTSLAATCRTLHLAFKQQSTDDIYDIMVLCFLRACRLYDPLYTDKVKRVCEVLNEKFAFGQFTAEAVTEQLGFSSVRYLRMLSGKKFLSINYGPRKKILGYRRGPAWPPAPSFFKAGPVGFTYYVSRWLKYHLVEYIDKEMEQIETRQGVLQLGHASAGDPADADSPNDRGGALPHSDGNYVGQDGTVWAADTYLMEAQLDLSTMTDAWVEHTTDRWFAKLSKQDRWLLQMLYVQEYSWVQIAKAMRCSIMVAQRQYQEIMAFLQGHAAPRVKLSAAAACTHGEDTEPQPACSPAELVEAEELAAAA